MIQTRIQAALNEGIRNRARVYARYFLENFKWTDEQRQFLEQVERNGYVITQYNEAAKLFGRQLSNDNEKQIMTVSRHIYGWRKKDISIYAL